MKKTKKRNYLSGPKEGYIIPDGEKVKNVFFCFVALANKNIRTLYTDVTGALLLWLIDNN